MECAGGRGLRGKRGMLQRGRGARVSALEPRENRKNARRGEGRRRGQKLGIQPSTKSVKFSEGGLGAWERAVRRSAMVEYHVTELRGGSALIGQTEKSNLSSNAKYCLTHTINGLYQWEVNGALKVIAWPQSRGSKGRRWISEGVRGSAGRAENPRRVWRGAKSKWGTEDGRGHSE